MPKVLIYLPTVGRGGVHLIVDNMLRGLKAYAPADWDFQILGQGYDEIHLPMEYPFRFEQLRPVHMLPAHPYLFPFLIKHAPDFVQHLNQVVERDQPDLIYCPSPWWTFRVQEWTLSKPIVCFIPDFAYDQGVDLGELLNGHFRFTANQMARRSTFTVFSADFHRDHAVAHYHFPPERTAVVHHSADFVTHNLKANKAEGKRVAKKYGLPDRYVLAFHPMGHKDPVTILNGQRYARSRGANVPPLVLAGIHTEQFLDTRNRRLRHMLESVHGHLNEDVFVTGFVEESDIGGLFYNAVCSISASMSEGDLSGATFTSMMCKVPHLYSRLPVYLDRMHEGMGYSFDVGDYETLGKLIIEVTDFPALAERKALTAFRWAQTRTLRDVIHEYLSLFMGVIDVS